MTQTMNSQPINPNEVTTGNAEFTCLTEHFLLKIVVEESREQASRF